jgi:hypothetical protein
MDKEQKTIDGFKLCLKINYRCNYMLMIVNTFLTTKLTVVFLNVYLGSMSLVIKHGTVTLLKSCCFDVPFVALDIWGRKKVEALNFLNNWFLIYFQGLAHIFGKENAM